MSHQEPGQDVWDKFWTSKQDIKKVYPSSPSVLRTIRRHFDLKGLKVLEVGAGSGRDSTELASQGAQVTVLDFSVGSLEIVAGLKEELHLAENLHLVRGDAFQAPLASESFDLVFHQGLAEHFDDPLPLLQENWRLLRTGGFCLCDVPQTIHIYTLIKHMLIMMDKWFAGWETQFTMGQLESLMKRADFKPVYKYGDWMRPNLFYRILREVGFKVGLELPKYPFSKTLLGKAMDCLQDRLADHPCLHWTQLSIGVLAQKAKVS